MSDAEDELTADDDWPAQFSQVPAWITMHPGLKSSAVRMWAFLALFVSPGKKVAYPGTALIASVLGLSRKDKVAPYTRQLVEAGAIRVEEQKTPSGRRYRYFLRFAPPVGYTGPVSTSDLKMLHPDGRGGGPEKGSTPKTGHSSGGGPEKGSMGGPEKGSTHGPQKGARTRTSGTTTKGTTGCGCGSTSTTDACACARDDADAPQQSKRERLADAIEREMAAQRAKAKAAEEASEPTLPVAWPPVRRDPNRGWIRTDGEPEPQDTVADEKNQQKPSRYVALDDGYMPPEALVRKLNQMYPGIDVRFEVSQFVSHYTTTGARRSNWHHVFEAWCERSAKHARERAARGSFQTPVQRRQQPTQADYANDLGYF